MLWKIHVTNIHRTPLPTLPDPIYLFTTYSTICLEKLTVPQLVTKVPAFYGTRRFITAFTNVHHLSLSWASSIQSIPPTSHFLKIHLNIILPSTPGSPRWSLSFRIHHQNPVFASSLPHTCHMPSPSHPMESTQLIITRSSDPFLSMFLSSKHTRPR